MDKNNEASQTLRMLIVGILIYFAICSVPVLIFSPDRLRFELGLVVGVILSIFMTVHMNYVVNRIVHMEAHQSAFSAWNVVLRLVIVAGFILLFGFLEWANVFTMLLGLFGLKISAYLEPLLIKLFKKNKG